MPLICDFLQVNYSFVRKEGHEAGHIICDLATEKHVDVIVVGTRGLGTIRRTILGSCSDYIIHHAHCAVIVCRQ